MSQDGLFSVSADGAWAVSCWTPPTALTPGRQAAKPRRATQDGQGLLIVYDGEGTLPSVWPSTGRTAKFEFVGAEEIHAVTAAMRCADKLAQAFGPRIPLLQLAARRMSGSPSRKTLTSSCSGRRLAAPRATAMPPLTLPRPRPSGWPANTPAKNSSFSKRLQNITLSRN